MLRSKLRPRHRKIWTDLAADKARTSQQRRKSLLGCDSDQQPVCSGDGGPPKDSAQSRQDLPEVFAGPDGLCLRAQIYLGSGAYGSVYRAEDEAGRTFALKIGQEHLLQDLSHEARLLAMFHHPGVVWSFGLTSTACNKVALKLECGHQNLGRYLDEQGSLNKKVCWRMVLQLLSALMYLHEKAVVHADVKPGNTLVFLDSASGSPDSCPRLKLCDFGLSVELGPEGHATVVGREVYTLPYRPFECAMANYKRVRIGPACDVFAMGALGFRVFRGRTLFGAETYETLLQDPTPQAQRSVWEYRDGQMTRLDSGVRALLSKMVAPPQQRAASSVLLAMCRDRLRVESLRTSSAPGAACT